MKIRLTLDEHNTVISLEIAGNQSSPLLEDEILVDENDIRKIQIGRTKYINGQFDFSETDNEEYKMRLRYYRQMEVFPIINRGQLWYDTLTNEQKEELRVWYQGWLDAPETLIVPNKPNWL